MAEAQLLELAQQGDLDQFESTCLEVLGGGGSLTALVRPFHKLERSPSGERVVELAQLVLDNAGDDADNRAALAIARSALMVAPKNDGLRQRLTALYKLVYADNPGFAQALEASGLEAERPARAAIKLLDVYLELKPGDTLIGRMDDRAVEIIEIDRANGIVNLRRQDRSVTVPASELAREYDRVDHTDFRVLRQLWPEKLTDLIKNKPVDLVIGLIHAHGESIDAEQLKDELVPRYIEPGTWSKWWTKARTQLKKSPYVLMEGRSPIILSYVDGGARLEDEAWRRFEEKSDPLHWSAVIEQYVRDKGSLNEPLDEELLQRCGDGILKYAQTIRDKRSSEALACTLLFGQSNGLPARDEAAALATDLLRSSKNPIGLISGQPSDVLWGSALSVLRAARPDDWVDFFLQLIPLAPSTQLDMLSEGAIEAGRAEAVQEFIDQSMSDPLHHAEILYWLWKGPRQTGSLKLPSDLKLLTNVLQLWTGLNRTTGKDEQVIRHFRHRMRTAFGLRDYGRVASAMKEVGEAAAITLKRQLELIEGVGDTVRGKMLDILRDVHPRLWLIKRRQIQPWEDKDTLYSTQGGIGRRVAERDEIENVQMRENAKRIGEAASHGDLSENSEYKFALEERDLLRARLARINDELSKARPIDVAGVPTDHVAIGTYVIFRRVSDGGQREMTFLGPFDGDVDQGIFSYLAPFAQRVMGLHIGDHVTVTLDGVEQEFEVLSIANALEPG